MIFAVWQGAPHRPTQDLDLLGYGDPSPERLIHEFQDACAFPVDPDGWLFDPQSVTAEEIRPADEYGGIRIHIAGNLSGAVVRLQVDIGFGDAVTPPAAFANYPVLLGQPSPHLKVYPAATVVAEKIEAITKLGMINTRFKDFYDLDFIADRFAFDGAQLVAAIQATFSRRGTPIPSGLPTGLTAAFGEDPAKQKQWQAFARRVAGSPTNLSSAILPLAHFLELPLRAAYDHSGFSLHWPPSGPWKKQ